MATMTKPKTVHDVSKGTLRCWEGRHVGAVLTGCNAISGVFDHFAGKESRHPQVRAVVSSRQ
jgi:hypothetical protein